MDKQGTKNMTPGQAVGRLPWGPKRRATVLGSVLALAVWILGLQGFFLSDYPLYDVLVRHPIVTQPYKPRVVVVEYAREPANAAAWHDLFVALHQLGVKTVALSYPPRSEVSAPPGLRLLVPSLPPHPPSPARSSDLASSSWRSDLVLTIAPTPRSGMSRDLYSAFRVGDELWPTLGWSLVNGGNPQPLVANTGINFQVGPGFFPVVSAESLQAGQLTPGLFAGRVAIIGPRSAPAGLGLSTPLNPDNGDISLTRFQAYAAQTWLDGSGIRPLSHWAVLLWLLLAAGFQALLFGALGLRNSVLYVLAVSVGTIVLEWWLLGRYGLWIPGMQLLAFRLLMMLGLFALRRMRHSAELGRFAVALSTRAHRADLPSGFFDAHTPWQTVAGIAANLVESRRMVFLQALGDQQLIVASVWQADADDMDATRLRADHEPFLSTAGLHRPLRSASPLLLNGAADDLEYLVPLVAGDRVFGFWICVMAGNRPEGSEDEAVLAQVAQHLGELLAQWDVAHSESQHLLPVLEIGSRKRLARSHPVQQMLALAARRLEGRLQLNERLIQHSVAGLALYDPYGFPLLTNPAMQTWARRRRLRLDQLSTVELLSVFCGSRDRARAIARQVHAGEELELSFPESGTAGRVIVRPVPAEGAAAMLGLSGILFELRESKASRDIATAENQDPAL